MECMESRASGTAFGDPLHRFLAAFDGSSRKGELPSAHALGAD
jgi:hypothetical protein